MAKEEQVYAVSLRKGFKMASRRRAGLVVLRNEVLETTLSKEQLEELRNDAEFVVESAGKAKAAAKKDDAGKSDKTAQSAAKSAPKAKDEPKAKKEGDDEPVVSTEPETQTQEGGNAPVGDTTQEGSEGEEETELDVLVRDHNREELVKMATEAGVEEADKLPNKPAIAEAILAKRG